MPRFPPGMRARLVVPPVWICLTPVAEEKLRMVESALKARLVFWMVVVPVVAPMVRVVAAWAKLTVVAVVLTRAKVDEGVVNEVVIAGEVAKTMTPVPVSSVMELSMTEEAAEEMRLEEASVKTALLAVSWLKLAVPPTPMFVEIYASPMTWSL